MKKPIIIFAYFIIISIATSCSTKTEPERIILPDTSVLEAQSSWGVITSNYLRLREKASVDSAALTGLTKGTVVELTSSTDRKETIDELTATWYRVNIDGIRGWMFGAHLEVFGSKAEAEKRAGEIR